MNSELAALAARLTNEFEAAEKALRAAQARLREVQEEIARVRNAAKLLDEPDPFAEALARRRREASAPPAKPTAAPSRAPTPMPVKDTPRAQADALFSVRPRES
jgi:peptidoglycan hydrolase CwlO-like protein